jgi:hypothetical protein
VHEATQSSRLCWYAQHSSCSFLANLPQFAYVTLCIYQIFTDYQPSPGSAASANIPSDPALPPLPPIIMASYTTLLHALGSLPTIIHTGYNLMVGAVMTITPSVIISLAYRVMVMYAATRIIPAIRESGARALSQGPSLDGLAPALSSRSTPAYSCNTSPAVTEPMEVR